MKGTGKGFLHTVKKGVTAVSDAVLEQISSIVQVEIERNFDRIEKRTAFLEELALLKVIGSLILFLGVVFFAISGFYFLRETVLWSPAASFFVMGLIVIVVGFILKRNERRILNHLE